MQIIFFCWSFEISEGCSGISVIDKTFRFINSAVDGFQTDLDRTKNTPIVRKAKLGIKLKVIMSSFISRLSSGQKSVASYCKMGR